MTFGTDQKRSAFDDAARSYRARPDDPSARRAYADAAIALAGALVEVAQEEASQRDDASDGDGQAAPPLAPTPLPELDPLADELQSAAERWPSDEPLARAWIEIDTLRGQHHHELWPALRDRWAHALLDPRRPPALREAVARGYDRLGEAYAAAEDFVRVNYTYERIVALAEGGPFLEEGSAALLRLSQRFLRMKNDLEQMIDHLRQLQELSSAQPDRLDWARAWAAALATVPVDLADLADNPAEFLMGRAKEARGRFPDDPEIAASFGRVFLRTQDPRDVVGLDGLRGALEPLLGRYPRHAGLRACWAETVFAITDALRLAKKWERIPGLRDAIAAQRGQFPDDGDLRLVLAKATRNVVFARESTNDVAAVKSELALLRDLRDEEPLDPRQRLALSEQWLWGALLAVMTYCDSGWRWGAGGIVEWLPNALELRDEAEQLLEVMWSDVEAAPSDSKAGRLAAAIQAHLWCLQQAKSEARWRAWYARLGELARRTPIRAVESEWAQATASRAVALAADGDAEEVVQIGRALERLNRLHANAASREAYAKALAAEANVRRRDARLDLATFAVEALAAFCCMYPAEAMLVRLFALPARELLQAFAERGDWPNAEATLWLLDRVLALPQGAGLGRRLFAQGLGKLIVTPRAPENAAFSDAALGALRRLARENPGDQAIAEQLTPFVERAIPDDRAPVERPPRPWPAVEVLQRGGERPSREGKVIVPGGSFYAIYLTGRGIPAFTPPKAASLAFSERDQRVFALERRRLPGASGVAREHWRWFIHVYPWDGFAQAAPTPAVTFEAGDPELRAWFVPSELRYDAQRSELELVLSNEDDRVVLAFAEEADGAWKGLPRAARGAHQKLP